MFRKIALGLALAVTPLALAVAQTTPQAELDAAIVGDPPFVYRAMKLEDLPKATGPAVELFNGKDLSNWDAWLGYSDPGLTYRAPPQAPIGPGGVGDVYNVVTVDGAPAIFITGKTWGGLVHKGDYSAYHLRLEYKWGKTTYAPRLNRPKNNGLLYHSHGAPGGVFGTWMAAVEFEILYGGSVGMMVPVGDNMRPKVLVGSDDKIPYPKRRYMPGGKEVIPNIKVAWNVEAAINAEKPDGEWNTLDLYVVGDKAIHVVNGVPVLAVHDIAELNAAGVRVPITHGRIQLQSEGAETYFRKMTLTPIAALPKIVPAP